MPLNINEISCWIVTEDLAGSRNQCIGIAEALGLNPEIKTITLKQPWKSLSPLIGFEQSTSFIPPLIGPPWPDLLLTCGRKSVAAARYIKRASGGKTLSVHIQDPRVNPREFDLVAVPAHDSLRGENVIVTQATPNRITPDKLAAAKTQFSAFEKLVEPRVAVLIGGNSKAYKLTPEITRNLCDRLSALPYSLMITTSRRTGAENEAILKDYFAGKNNAYFWDGQGENPYLGILGWADAIMVTSDSASMLSEACTTGKPVYMISLEGGGKRLDKLHRNLQQSGALRIFNGALENWTYEPLNDTAYVADEIRKRLQG